MIKLALVGKGKWGSRYLEVVKNIPGVEIKYVVTRNYHDLHNYSDIDGIIIASPDSTHAEIARTFPNKYLLIEKPFTTSLESALEITNPKVMVGHTYLYNTALMENMKTVGNIKYFGFRLCNVEEPENTTPLWYLGPHGISLCLHFFGEPKNSKVWQINRNIFIKLDYETTTCILEVGGNYPTKQRQIVALGQQGAINFDDSLQQPISPLENELRSFIGFIGGKNSITGLEHAYAVERILAGLQNQLDDIQ